LHSCQYEITEIDAAVDDQERLIVELAAGRLGRVHLTDWLRPHLRPLP
jgi:death-on-curing protein